MAENTSRGTKVHEGDFIRQTWKKFVIVFSQSVENEFLTLFMSFCRLEYGDIPKKQYSVRATQALQLDFLPRHIRFCTENFLPFNGHL